MGGTQGVTSNMTLTSGNVKLATLTYGNVTYSNVDLKMTPGTYNATLYFNGSNTPVYFNVELIAYTVNSSTPAGLPQGSLGTNVGLGPGYTPTSFALSSIQTSNGSSGKSGTMTSGNMVFPTFTFENPSNGARYTIAATPATGITIPGA